MLTINSCQSVYLLRKQRKERFDELLSEEMETKKLVYFIRFDDGDFGIFAESEIKEIDLNENNNNCNNSEDDNLNKQDIVSGYDSDDEIDKQDDSNGSSYDSDDEIDLRHMAEKNNVCRPQKPSKRQKLD